MRIQYPVVTIQLVLCWIGFALVYFQVWSWVFPLLFQPTYFTSGGISFDSAMVALEKAQFWRVLSPAYLHFGWFHIAFNSMCLWLLGKELERRKGPLTFVLFCVAASAISNMAQYLLVGPHIFGGFSGVVYAMAGYILVFDALNPDKKYDIPKGLIVQLMIFLVIGVTGILEFFNIARVANAAHIGGLVVGAAYGLLSAKKF